jgi:predicted PurR-regulated permease PerM
VDEGPEDVSESTDAILAATQRSEHRFWLRLGALLLLAVLGYLVWRIVTPLWQPLLWALLLGSVLAPFNTRLAQRLGGRPRLASAVTTLLAVLLFLLPVATVAGGVAAQAAQLLRDLEQRVPQIGDAASFDLSAVPWLKEPLAWLGEHTAISVSQLQSSGGSWVLSALGTFFSFALMLFVLFFVLRDGPDLARTVVRMLPIEERRRARLSQHLKDVTRAVFLGIGLTALIQGTLVGIGFGISGLPSPLVFGVVAVLFALVPFVGTVIVWAPAAIYLAARGDYGHAIFLALWGALLVGMVDNFLRPFLISGRSAVPTLAVFIGVMGGLAAFGFIGLFLGPIVLGLLVALFRFEAEELEGAGAAR